MERPRPPCQTRLLHICSIVEVPSLRRCSTISNDGSSYYGRPSSLSTSSAGTLETDGMSRDETLDEEALPPLPPGWTVVMGEAGVFYWNEVNGQIMRLRPTWKRKIPPRKIRIRTRTDSGGSLSSRASTPRNTPRATPTRGFRQPNFSAIANASEGSPPNSTP